MMTGPGVKKSKKNKQNAIYHDSYFTAKKVLSTAGGGANNNSDDNLKYYERLQLVDNNNVVWHRARKVTDKGYIQPLTTQGKPQGRFAVEFESPVKARGSPVCFGDTDISLRLYSTRSGTAVGLLSNFKRSSTNLQGGYLVWDGSGKKIAFRMDRHSSVSENNENISQKDDKKNVDSINEKSENDPDEAIESVSQDAVEDEGQDSEANVMTSDEEEDHDDNQENFGLRNRKNGLGENDDEDDYNDQQNNQILNSPSPQPPIVYPNSPMPMYPPPLPFPQSPSA